MSPPEARLQIAVIDDDAQQRLLLRQALEEAEYDVLEGADGQEAVDLALSQSLDAMLLDVRMPRMDGLEALRRIKAAKPEMAVILLTAYIDLRDAVEAIKTGAQDYLEKPVDLDELVVAVDDALGITRSSTYPADGEDLDLPEDVVAESPALQAVFREARRVAPTDLGVLILGESGTGKEVLARYIHNFSQRAQGSFVAVNSAALPENLIESELFGHEKGAFTGAVTRKAGRFEEASGGTLFLDEIGEMPLTLQPKLLRVLEARQLRLVGGLKDIPVNVRILAATHRDLEVEVRQGRFREDLLYRINVLTLRIPPLRERREDILPLAERFLKEQGLHGKRFSPAAQRILIEAAWPGNVRQLRNAAVRAGLLSRGSLILPEELPETLRPAETGENADAIPKVPPGGMDEIQKQAILKALKQTAGNKTRAAQLLGISRRNLIYKLRSYGL